MNPSFCSAVYRSFPCDSPIESFQDGLNFFTEQARWLFEPEQVIELRVLDYATRSGTATYNGYFQASQLEQMMRLACEYSPNARGVYYTLNPVQPELLARRANRLGWAKREETTTDRHILRRRWLLLDIDPVRPSGISATDTEKKRAADKLEEMLEALLGRGWPAGLVIDSGNGYHALFRLELPAQDEQLVQQTLQALAKQFNTDHVHIDTTVFNPSRIARLPGTLARKGDALPDRPYRRARLLALPRVNEPSEMGVLDPESLREVIAEWGTPPQTAAHARRSSGPASAPSGARVPHRLDVARWLTDRGMAFRIAATPDCHNRTRFILAHCPFNPEHQDPDSAIFQAEDGQLAARCFHNSCQGRGWKAFRDQIGAPEAHHYDPSRTSERQRRNPGGAIPPTPPPPINATIPQPSGPGPIVVNNRQLADLLQKAQEALVAGNQPPRLFVSQGRLARLRPIESESAPIIEVLTNDALMGHLAQAALWMTIQQNREGEEIITNVPPPTTLVKALNALPIWPGIPVLDGIVAAPYFTSTGQVITTPGYNPESRLWYEPTPGFDIPAIPKAPSREQLDQARDLLLQEVLGDFPFVDQASRAHTLALLLLPFVRPMIRGHTPLHLIDAPTEGTGKSLLVQVLTTIAQGYPTQASPEAKDPDEWRKRLTALLVEGRPSLWFDNLNQTLDSGALAAVLTTRSWTDRILGVSKMAHAQNRAVWIATGNNVSLSRELVRRTLWIRINARVERPAERTGYRHPKLLQWVNQNRAALLQAALTLIQGWIHHGQPQGQQTMGMFEDWVELLGGILEVAGVPGLLENRPQFQQQQQHTTDDWPAFLQEWWNRLGSQPVGTAQLIQLANDGQYLDEVLGDGGPRSQRSRLGRRLAKMIDRIIGEWRLESAGQDRSDRQLYRLHQYRANTTVTEVLSTIGQ